MKHLIKGLRDFKNEVHSSNKEMYSQLALKQTPHTVFIACSDSRIDPNGLTQTKPGSLFHVRNVGNLVPPPGSGMGEESAIEYAIEVLGTRRVIVCGHSHCGAMKGLLAPASLDTLPATKAWLQNGRDSLQRCHFDSSSDDHEKKLDFLVKQNVIVQVERLKSLPCIMTRLAAGEIELHGWVYYIESGEVYSYDPIRLEFVLLND